MQTRYDGSLFGEMPQAFTSAGIYAVASVQYVLCATSPAPLSDRGKWWDLFLVRACQFDRADHDSTIQRPVFI